MKDNNLNFEILEVDEINTSHKAQENENKSNSIRTNTDSIVLAPKT